MAKEKKSKEKKSKEKKGKKKTNKKGKKELEEGDFVELDYIGKEKGGEVFDTNVKEKAKEMGINIESRPVIICLGENMILPAIDKFLIGKEAGKEYNLELPPEKAFGKRQKEKVKTMPMKVFERHGINPRRGMAFNFDNKIGKIKAVSGARVIVDFNNPMASKDVEYNLKPKKKIKDKETQVKATMKTLLNKEPDFEIEGDKVVVDSGEDEQLGQILGAYKEKLGEILDMEITIKGEAKEKEDSEAKPSKEKENKDKTKDKSQ